MQYAIIRSINTLGSNFVTLTSKNAYFRQKHIKIVKCMWKIIGIPTVERALMKKCRYSNVGTKTMTNSAMIVF